MIAVIQRVSSASVNVNKTVIAQIDQGLLILLGVHHSDTMEDLQWLASKIAGLRIFNDEDGKMNRSIIDISGEILLVSQFTLIASTKKGNKPSFIDAARPDQAEYYYEKFKSALNGETKSEIKTGKFGADMAVSLVNDGPVTIIIDTKNKQ